MLGGGVWGVSNGQMAVALLGGCCIILGAVKMCPLIPGPIPVTAGSF